MDGSRDPFSDLAAHQDDTRRLVRAMMTLTGLTGSTAYTQLQIRAVTSAGSGTATANFSGTTVLAAPTITGITFVDGTVSLPVSITSPAGTITSWQYTTDGTNWKTGTVATGVMTISQTSPAGTTALSVNTAYSVTVRANSAAGTGTASTAVAGTTLPAAPTISAYAGYTGDGTKMTLTIGAASGSASITGYKWSTNGSTWTAATIVDSTTVLVSGLATNTRYSAGTKVQLIATNAGGDSSAGNIGTSYTTPAAPTVGAVTSITASGFSLPVTWVAGGAGYTAPTAWEYSLDGGAYTSVASVATSYTLVLSGLSSNTTYSVRVRAKSTAGSGTAASAVSATTIATVTVIYKFIYLVVTYFTFSILSNKCSNSWYIAQCKINPFTTI